jgi:protein-tyrosine phosphatase
MMRLEEVDKLERRQWKGTMSTKLFWIPGPWRGRLAISTRPRGGDWLPDEIQSLRDSGIDVLVSLLEPQENADLDLSGEASASADRGIRFVGFPVPDRSVPASRAASVALIADIGALLDRGESVAVHCRQGVGRSGLIAAGTLVLAGYRPVDAMNLVSAVRGETVPETDAQRAWLEQLPAVAALAG